MIDCHSCLSPATINIRLRRTVYLTLNYAISLTANTTGFFDIFEAHYFYYSPETRKSHPRVFSCRSLTSLSGIMFSFFQSLVVLHRRCCCTVICAVCVQSMCAPILLAIPCGRKRLRACVFEREREQVEVHARGVWQSRLLLSSASLFNRLGNTFPMFRHKCDKFKCLEL